MTKEIEDLEDLRDKISKLLNKPKNFIFKIDEYERLNNLGDFELT